MQKDLSPTTRSILALINNIEELISISNKRKEAMDVMKAVEIYANSNNVTIPNEKIDRFYCVLLDSRPITLSHILMDIGHDIITSERKKTLKISKSKK